MLCDIACRWKQIIRYYFTGDGFNGATLQPIIIDILHKAESIGLRVNFIYFRYGTQQSSFMESFWNHGWKTTKL